MGKTNLNNFRTVDPILTQIGMELRLDTAQTPEVSKPPYLIDVTIKQDRMLMVC